MATKVIIISGLVIFFGWCLGYSNTHPEEMKKHYEYEKWKKNPTNASGEVCCPKCRSTQIQMVNRKWSATTGFMTNKVDRVCMNCKHRF